tara:strand:+ start:738 stop:1373 length:636 start_codon:yes stop_codon:yes gene_type:complete
MVQELDSSKILYSSGNNDECYTPDYAVEPILEYIPEGATVWCPFDTDASEFVRLISKKNKVIKSHLDDGQDFLQWQPKEHWDLIVSNPPFSNKRKFFDRALRFNKPFALIMANTWLNDSAPKQLFMEYNKELQLLMFDQRMEFNQSNGKVNNKITFSSSYFCWNFLFVKDDKGKKIPKQIILQKLNKPKIQTVPQHQVAQDIQTPLTELLY